MNTDEEKLAAVKHEQEIAAAIADNHAKLQATLQTLSERVTVVTALEQDKAMLEEERIQLKRILLDPRAHGTTATKAGKSLSEVGRGLRRVRAELEIAYAAGKRVQRAKDALVLEQKALVRAQRRNVREQMKLGLIPRPKRRETQAPLIELAQYTGLLDGSW